MKKMDTFVTVVMMWLFEQVKLFSLLNCAVEVEYSAG